jgi:uncharacterized protein (DUF2249 family)
MSTHFLELFAHPAPALGVKYRPSDADAKIVKVEHRLAAPPGAPSCAFLDALESEGELAALREFYRLHDGAELCRYPDPRSDSPQPLITLLAAQDMERFTLAYRPEGKVAWVVDHNKSRQLYRGNSDWITIAVIGRGPLCLTMFVRGDLIGHIYYLAPQPHFNNLKPIAKGFGALLARIAKDLPAFLRLVRAQVTLRGADEFFYGHSVVEYLPDRRVGTQDP